MHLVIPSKGSICFSPVVQWVRFISHDVIRNRPGGLRKRVHCTYETIVNCFKHWRTFFVFHFLWFVTLLYASYFSRAQTNCDVFVLTKKDLDEVLTHYPQIRKKILETAEERQRMVAERAKAFAKKKEEDKKREEENKLKVIISCWIVSWKLSVHMRTVRDFWEKKNNNWWRAMSGYSQTLWIHSKLLLTSNESDCQAWKLQSQNRKYSEN